MAKYAYLSDGTKLSATSGVGNGLFYTGSLVYRMQENSLSLENAGFAGGRFVAEKTADGKCYTPHYLLTDHLGSVRVVVDGSTGEVLERSNYYPFGLRWTESGSQISDNRYRYNGKEEQTFVDVPYIDYGARMYDPKIRLNWNGIDLLAKNHSDLSPYVFCANNPICMVDLLGLDYWYTNDPNEIAKFFQQYGSGQSFNMDNWTHKTDEEFLNEDPENDSYIRENDNGDVFFIWKTSDNNGIQVNAFRFKGIRSPLFQDFDRENDHAGQVLSSLGIMSGIGSELMYSSLFGTWLGKDFKLHTQRWGGNKYSGGKIKFAAKYAKYFKWTGGITTVLTASNIELMHEKGILSDEQRWI